MNDLKKAKLQFYVVVTLLVAFLIYVFLSSSPAGAHYGLVTDTPYRLNSSLSCNNCDKLGNSSVYFIQAQAFNAKHTPVPYQTLVWPALPTTTETLIRVANKRLAEVMEASKQEVAIPVAPNWDRFWVILAAALGVTGLMLVLLGVLGGLTISKPIPV